MSSTAIATATVAAATNGIALPPLGGFNVSSSQEAQIQQILGELQGGVVTPDQAQARISAVLDNVGTQSNVKTLAPKPATEDTKLPEPFPSLNLSTDQKKQIEKIFGNAKDSGASSDDVRSQVDAVLSPDQRQQLKFLSSYTKTGATSEPAASLVLFAAA